MSDQGSFQSCSWCAAKDAQIAVLQKELREGLAFNADLHGQRVDLRKRIAALEDALRAANHDIDLMLNISENQKKQLAALEGMIIWVHNKIKTLRDYSPPTDGRDRTQEIQGKMHILCYAYDLFNEVEKARCESQQKVTALEAEVGRLKDILGPYGCLPPHDPTALAHPVIRVVNA